MSDRNYCPNCGSKINEGDAFCSECGTKLESNNFNKGRKEKKAINKNVIIVISSILLVLSAFTISYFCSFKLRQAKNNTSEDIASSTSNIDEKYDSEDESEEVSKKESNDIKDDNKSNEENEKQLTAQLYDEKQVFADLLRNKDWLTQNAEYGKAKDSIKFLCLDVNKDGVSELLLAHEGNAGLAGLTLSVIFCDPSTGNITKKDINTSHGGYIGYLNDKNTIVVNFSTQGYSMLIGWKSQGNDFVQDFKTEDDIAKSLDTSQSQCKINDSVVDYNSYINYINSINNSLVCTEMHPLSENNIQAMLNQ